ncbi:MAG: hypothetical protein ABGZ35_10910 [Planctomycetaceae bacterium]
MLLRADHTMSQVTNDYAGASDIGQQRKTNDDNYLIADLRRLMHVCDTSVSSMQEDRFGPRPGHLLMVADGMGATSSANMRAATPFSL